jgi:hypothetical protein
VRKKGDEREGREGEMKSGGSGESQSRKVEVNDGVQEVINSIQYIYHT